MALIAIFDVSACTRPTGPNGCPLSGLNLYRGRNGQLRVLYLIPPRFVAFDFLRVDVKRRFRLERGTSTLADAA